MVFGYFFQQASLVLAEISNLVLHQWPLPPVFVSSLCLRSLSLVYIAPEFLVSVLSTVSNHGIFHLFLPLFFVSCPCPCLWSVFVGLCLWYLPSFLFPVSGLNLLPLSLFLVSISGLWSLILVPVFGICLYLPLWFVSRASVSGIYLSSLSLIPVFVSGFFLPAQCTWQCHCPLIICTII